MTSDVILYDEIIAQTTAIMGVVSRERLDIGWLMFECRISRVRFTIVVDPIPYHITFTDSAFSRVTTEPLLAGKGLVRKNNIAPLSSMFL